MIKTKLSNPNIPISVSLDSVLSEENIGLNTGKNKKRILLISLLSVLIAFMMSIVARLLVNLINLITNIAFHGTYSTIYSSPADNTLKLFVIAIPVIGGVIVGFMAFYGSKAIRGHGIPEAMEQILTNQSKIKPVITILKPLSAAISIGTGGPFGAEGPIIATGGALGSSLGQVLSITNNERKILLTAGATAGMAAIFGSPLAGIFLAIELLLFEFSARSIIPVAFACITGAGGHYLLFDQGPVFAIKNIQMPSYSALFAYSVIGIFIGIMAVIATKIIYFVEDCFEMSTIHWSLCPALGGLAVGLVGYFSPETLGVGYENITNILSDTMAISAIFSLCIFKFISWAIALGSGTSGGTLAPLLTIGSATGALCGSVLIGLFPSAGITISLAALVGMAAMFAGASRALLTSIIFALETTGQFNALLALLATCSASYFVSYFLMENTIMTEKIARRGVKTPHIYESDILEKIKVGEVIKSQEVVFYEDHTIEKVRHWLKINNNYKYNYYIISNLQGGFVGIVSSSDLFSSHYLMDTPVKKLVKYKPIFISSDCSLRIAAQMMAEENIEAISVISNNDNKSIIGIISHQEIIKSFKYGMEEHSLTPASISIQGKNMKIVVWGRRLIKRSLIKF